MDETVTLTELREIAPKRFIVGFSDGTELRLSLDSVAELSLYSGREFSAEDYAALRGRAALSQCKERALRLIRARAMACSASAVSYIDGAWKRRSGMQR